MGTIGLLEVDPELGCGITVDELPEARRALLVPELRLMPGPWDPSALAGLADALLGAVIVDGRLQRTIEVGGRATTHLFGAGDVVRPWDDDELELPGAPAISWAVSGDVHLALLDRRFVVVASRWPGVLVELARRAARQTARVQLQVAIAQLGRVDERVMLLLWRLGQRWGRMTPDGIVVPLALTHAAIARLVGATRPPVSTALGELSRAGLVQRLADGWLVDLAVEAQVERMLSAAGPARPLGDPDLQVPGR